MNGDGSDQPAKPKESIWKIVIWIIVALVAFAFAKTIGRQIGREASGRFSSGYSVGQTEKALAAGIQETVKEIKPQLPLKVDQETTLISVLGSGKQIIYIYSVSSDFKSTQIEDLKTKMHDLLQNRVCNEKSTEFLIKSGGIMTYQYTDTSGDSFMTSIDSCN